MRSDAQAGGRRLEAAALATLPMLGVAAGGLNHLGGSDLLCIGAGLLLAVMVLFRPPPDDFWRAAWPVLALAGGAVGWAALSLARAWVPGAGTPVAPDLGVPALLGAIGAIGALLCGAVAGERPIQLARLADWSLLWGCAGLLLSLAALRWDAGWSPWITDDEGRFLGTLGNANAAGVVYGALAVLALARALGGDASPWRSRAPSRCRAAIYAHWAALALLLAGCLLTASRSGAAMTAAALGAVLWRSGVGRRRTWLVLALAGAAVVLGASDRLFERFGHLPDETGLRALLWRHNWEVAWGAPLFGHGPGSFPVVNLRSLTELLDAQAMWMVNSPHNIGLRLIIEGGLPCLLLAVGGAVTLAVQVARRRPLDLMETALAAAVAIVLGSALVDIALEVPAITALALSWTGLLWGRAIGRSSNVRIPGPRLDPARREGPVAAGRARGVEQPVAHFGRQPP